MKISPCFFMIFRRVSMKSKNNQQQLNPLSDSLHPIFQFQAIYAFEFFGVIGQ